MLAKYVGSRYDSYGNVNGKLLQLTYNNKVTDSLVERNERKLGSRICEIVGSIPTLNTYKGLTRKHRLSRGHSWRAIQDTRKHRDKPICFWG